VTRSSAGILLYRQGADGSLEVLIVHPGGPFWKNRDAHSWSVPKGEYGPGESAERAAEREFAEELGSPVPAGERLDLGEVRQSGGKRVRAWALRAQGFSPADFVSNRFEMEWPPKSGRLESFPEVDRAEWVPLEGARERLVRAQADFIDRLLDHITS
jgi:predicted NUDIX family NTP pyrophosphohydrolase